MRRHLASILLAVALLPGCAHRVLIQSDPPGAAIWTGRRARGPAPQELTFLWLPFRPIKVRVTAQGYRPTVINVGRYASPGVILRDLLGLHFKRLAGLEPRATVSVMLIREHGAVGTWTEDDVKR
jgi:hypothetical protein